MRFKVSVVAFAVGSLAFASAAQARTFEVTRQGDPVPGNCGPNDCSLREAVLAANEHPGADKIDLPNRRKPYRLTIPNEIPPTNEDGAMTGDLDTTNDRLTIVHPGRGQATIMASAGFGDRLLEAFARLTVNKLKLTGGAAQGSSETGGAIHAIGSTTVKRSTLVNNDAQGVGGAIDLEEDTELRVVRSKILRNFSDNTSGAIRSGQDGPITIVDSRLQGNRTTGDGGAIRLSSAGPVRIIRSTIAGNRAGQNGGGIQNDAEQPLTIRDSTISGNRAGGNGGGLDIGGDAEPTKITNSTIAGNTALDFGGGVIVTGSAPLSLNAVTIARNHGSADDTGVHAPGGGIFRSTTGTVSVRNTIIALNRLGTEPIRNDCGGEVGEPFDSLGNNLLSVTSSICNGFDQPGDRVRSNPKLGKLKRNGGPTKTVALKKGSPAIGRAHKPSAPNRDQRGVRRDNDPDIGAFER